MIRSLLTDAYKLTHWRQYPERLEHVYSYLESRGGKFPLIKFFGLQYILKRYLEGGFLTSIDNTSGYDISHDVFGFNYYPEEKWDKLISKHEGRLPIRIKAVPEGSVVPFQNVLMTVENLDPEFPWLTNYIESLLMQVWYPTTVCTLSFYIKEMIKKYCDATGCEVSDYHLNDFGVRGASSMETAAIGGMAHLVNFDGTDNLPAIVAVKDYYGFAHHDGHRGRSVLATEHSTMTINGRDGEFETIKRIINTSPWDATISIVIDSYDTMKVIEYMGTELKDLIMSRQGQVVFRPDSGHPVTTSLYVMEKLQQHFGTTRNEQGYCKLPQQVGIIYGDGIGIDEIERILIAFADHQFAATNIVFGMGGHLLQQVNRDTCNFAIKCSAASFKGEKRWRDVYKDPSTDQSKKSKRGRLKLVDTGHGFKTIRKEDKGMMDKLVTVFENGYVTKEYNFDEVIANG